ncbi:MAG: PAS domain-containing sensor histidine kinase, partial [Leptolyngbya sp.]|nr:PAS domain-containing sensor histidine kinase [Candidatus Melainabacteria bacterium]
AQEALSSILFDVVLINYSLLASDPSLTISLIRMMCPTALLIANEVPDDDATPIRLINLGVSDSLVEGESDANTLRRAILKTLEKNDTGSWLMRQISDTLLTSTFDGAILIDKNQEIRLWNPAMERIFEVNREDAVSHSFEKAFSFLQKTDEISRVVEAMNNKKIVSRDRYFYNDKTGKAGYFTAFYHPVLDRRGEVVGVFGIIRDVTFSKLSERNSLEMAQRLIALTNTSSNMQWISDSADDRIFFNKRWLDFTGSTFDEERGFGWRRHIHPIDLKKYRAVVDTALQRRLPWHIEVRLEDQGGKFVRFLESAFPLFLPDKTFIGYVGYCTDVNAARTTNPKAPNARESMRTFNSLDLSPIGVVHLDNDLTIRHANTRVQDLFGIPIKELVGTKIKDVLGNFDMTTLQVVLERGEKVQLENHRIIIDSEQGQSVRYWDISCWPQKNHQLKIDGICMSFIEATERYTDVQQKEEFVAALVHDLKTPLIGAERTLEAMLKGALGPIDSSHEQMLSVLRNSNKSLLTMVQSMIDVHRSENELLNLSLDTVKIDNLVAECAEELKVLFSSNGIQLKCHFENSAKDAGVLGDRLALRRVILNLLDNALKFTPYSGSVEMSVRSKHGALLLEISDSGIGVELHDRENIFSKSFQGNVGKQIGGSAGIGLYVCRKIIRAHNGDITYSENIQGGSTFIIQLPQQLTQQAMHSVISKNIV